MKKIISLLFVIILGINLYSQQVNYTTAFNVAQNTINESFSIIDDEYFKIVSYHTENIGLVTVYYVFDLKPRGFIIVSADKSATPILAFSSESNYSIDDNNPAVSFWLNNYKKQINYNILNNIKPDKKTEQAWSHLEVEPAKFICKKNNRVVNKLLTTTWDQGLYYNSDCPEDNDGPDGHVVVGCVATALGQLMNYFRHPLTGTGSYGYNHDDYGWIEVDFSEQTYDYDYMPVEPNDYNDNIARLLYNIGASVDMNYGPDGSGMWNHKGAYTLRTYFGYNDTTNYLFKDSLPEDFDWNGTLINHLNQKIPLYYAGWGDYEFISGHAFILDGYSDSTHYHINWGWGGSQDGYFVIDDLTPGGANFTLLHEVIVNATPFNQTLNCSENKIINSYEGIIEDGSGPLNNYQNNTECSWLIAPNDSARGIEFEVLKLYMDDEDYIIVFDGENDQAPVIETITGSSTVESFESTSDKVLIKFITNSDSVNDGWLISYKGIKPKYCNLTETITTPTGTVTDGSSSYLYQNRTFCNWYIEPEEAENIKITFTEFDLEPIRDYIKIYDSSNRIVADLSGNQIPDPILVHDNKITISFKTNYSKRAQGFSLNYETNVDNVDNIVVDNIKIYPNPVSDYLNIVSDNIEDIEFIKIYSYDGKLIYSDIKNNNKIDCRSLKNGVYFIEITTENNTSRKRFIKTF